MPRLTVTEPGWTAEKCCARNPSFKAETEFDWGLWRPSGLFATDLSKTANIFGGWLVGWEDVKWYNRTNAVSSRNWNQILNNERCDELNISFSAIQYHFSFYPLCPFSFWIIFRIFLWPMPIVHHSVASSNDLSWRLAVYFLSSFFLWFFCVFYSRKFIFGEKTLQFMFNFFSLYNKN